MATENTNCAACYNLGRLHCKGCDNIRYCSKDCQESDWPVHKLLCNTFKDFQDRPSPNARCGILFPTHGLKPKFIWLTSVALAHSGAYCEGIEEEEDLLKADHHNNVEIWNYPEYIPIQWVHALARKLPHTIKLCFRGNFVYDGSLPNQSIAKIMHTAPTYLWRGPMIAWGMHGVGRDPSRTVDLDTTDLSMIVNYLLDYGDKSVDTVNVHIPHKVQGVLVNCSAEMKIFDKPPYEMVDLPASHAIFRQRDTQQSQIAARIGTPLLSRMTAQKSAWNKAGSNVQKGIVTLHIQIEDDEKTKNGLGWGWAPLYWLLNTSNVLVVRQDRKPLTIKELGNMCSWATKALLPRLETVMEAGQLEAAKAAFVATINRNDLDDHILQAGELSTMLTDTNLEDSNDD
jgi:hypothetical protein